MLIPKTSLFLLPRDWRCSASLAVLPRAELSEKGLLFRIRHRGLAAGLTTFVDKARKENLQRLGRWIFRYRHIPLQPLLRRGVTRPARKLGGFVVPPPFWMGARCKQPLEIRERSGDEVGAIAVTLGAVSQIGCNQHG